MEAFVITRNYPRAVKVVSSMVIELVSDRSIIKIYIFILLIHCSFWFQDVFLVKII